MAKRPRTMTTDAQDALEEVRLRSSDQKLRPEDVVAAASPEDSPLHYYFTWDDTVAAHKFRLEQARFLIRKVFVTFEIRSGDQAKEIEVRAYTSLPPDRSGGGICPGLPDNYRGGGGQRSVVEVIKETPRRHEMLACAYAELGAFRSKYCALSELAVVILAIEETLARRGDPPQATVSVKEVKRKAKRPCDLARRTRSTSTNRTKLTKKKRRGRS